MSEYPEHEKLTETMKLSEFTQRLGEWLEENDFKVCQQICRSCHRPAHSAEVLEALPYSAPHEETEWVRAPIPGGIQGLLAQMFNVDLDELEREKVAMLDAAVMQ